MDNSCNVVINVSFNGRSYNYFFYVLMSYPNVQIRKKAALPNIKGRNNYGVYGLRDLGFSVYCIGFMFYCSQFNV